MSTQLRKYAYIPHSIIYPKGECDCQGDLVARVFKEGDRKVISYKCDWCWEEFDDSGILNALINSGKDPAMLLACLEIESGAKSDLTK